MAFDAKGGPMPSTEREQFENDRVAEAIAQAKFKDARLRQLKARHRHYLAEQRADLDVDSEADNREEQTQEL
jgi:hypothetical protein